MPALAELEAAWVAARDDAAFRAELGALLRDYVGRPTPLYHAARLSEAAGRPVYLKREDLCHTGAHKINNALGQCLLAKRMGKTRIIAETGAGQHGVATATACALLGLECVVYMGTEDMRRQKPNVERMGLLGATRRARRRRRAHAQGGRLGGDPRLGGQRRRHPLRHRLGRRPGAVPGARARPPARDRRRGARPDARARSAGCPRASSPASAAARTRSASSSRSSTTRRSRSSASRPAGDGIEHRPPRRAADRSAAAAASCTAPTRRSCRTRTARSSRRTRSRPGSTTPAPAPSTRTCATPAARATSRSPTPTRSPPSSAVAQLEGIIPALESSHALAWVLARRREAAGDADAHRPRVPVGPRRQGPRRGARRDRMTAPTDATRASSGSRRRSPARPAARGADALPDGRLPRRRDARSRIGEAYADGGADLRRARRAVLGPAGRRPGHPRRRHPGARGRRATLHDVLEVGARLAERLPVVLMCYANRVSRAASSASPTSSPSAASAG